MIALPNTPARLLLGRRIVALLLLGLFLAPLPAAAGDRELDEAVSDRDTRAIARRMGELAREDPARALRLVPLAYARVEKAPWESFYVADRYAVFTAALRALRQACSPTATDILKGALVNSREWPVRFLILEASLQISSLDSVDLSLRAIKDPVPQVSAVAARILGRSKEIVALAPLLVALKRWESPARREKVARGGRKALAADEAGKAWLACRDALHRLTGVSLHNHLAYKSYIRAHREEIDPKKVDVSKPKEEKTGVGLFGLDVTGRNIIFILDISGSMESTDPLTPKQLEKLNRPRTGVAGAGDELEKKLLAERRRIRRAKRELTSVVKSLAEDRRFNLIAYSSEVRPWGKTLEQATPGAKKKAVRFIDGLKAQGVTFTDLALAEAIADPRVDTIYLITDGAPTHVGSRGRDLPEDASRLMKRILLETRSVNYLRGIRIFTLGFEGAEEAFLKRLAAEHEGIYVRIE